MKYNLLLKQTFCVLMASSILSIQWYVPMPAFASSYSSTPSNAWKPDDFLSDEPPEDVIVDDAPMYDDFGNLLTPLSQDQMDAIFNYEEPASVEEAPGKQAAPRSAVVAGIGVGIIASILYSLSSSALTIPELNKVSSAIENGSKGTTNYPLEFSYNKQLFKVLVKPEFYRRLNAKIANENAKTITLTDEDKYALIRSLKTVNLSRSDVNLKAIEGYPNYYITTPAFSSSAIQVYYFPQSPDFGIAGEDMGVASFFYTSFGFRNAASVTGYSYLPFYVCDYTLIPETGLYELTKQSGFPSGKGAYLFSSGLRYSCFPFNIVGSNLGGSKYLDAYLSSSFPQLTMVHNPYRVVTVEDIMALDTIAVDSDYTKTLSKEANLYGTMSGLNRPGGGGGGTVDQSAYYSVLHVFNKLSIYLGATANTLQLNACILDIAGGSSKTVYEASQRLVASGLIGKTGNSENNNDNSFRVKSSLVASFILALKARGLSTNSDQLAAGTVVGNISVVADSGGSIPIPPGTADLAGVVSLLNSIALLVSPVSEISATNAMMAASIKNVDKWNEDIANELAAWQMADWMAGLTGSLDGIDQRLKDKAVSDEEDARSFIGSLTGIDQRVKDMPKSMASEMTTFFTIDQSRLKQSFNGLSSTLNIKFSALQQLSLIFSNINYAFDNSIPVFTMQTPTALKFAIKSERIVIMDLRPYADIFFICRTILIAVLWYAFAMWVLDQFDVKFHVG